MSERPTDWKNEPETLYFQDGYRTNKKGKKKPKYTLYEPNDPTLSVGGVNAPESTPPGSMTSGSAMYNPSAMPKGKAPTSTGTSSSFGYEQANQIGNDVGQAPRGSLASGISDSQMPFVGADPYAMADLYMMGQGLDQGSAVANLASSLYNPRAKALGMGLTGFSSDAEAINFGEKLFDRMMTGTGEQLNGLQMVETALVEFAKAQRNPTGAGLTNEFATMLLNKNPQVQLEAILGTVEGILIGTMPEESINSILGQMKQVGLQYMRGLQTDSNPIESEQAGKNMVNALLNWFQGAL